MSSELPDTSKADLRQLWGGGKVPSLSSEEIDLSLKLWQKIKSRKQREQKLGVEKKMNES